jgi:hypothetical protein
MKRYMYHFDPIEAYLTPGYIAERACREGLFDLACMMMYTICVILEARLEVIAARAFSTTNNSCPTALSIL